MSYLRFPLTAFAMVALLAGVPAADSHAQARTKIKYALGDVISIDELPLLVAAERAKKRGVDVEITSFKSEEVATQAVINGQADIGQGTPYAAVTGQAIGNAVVGVVAFQLAELLPRAVERRRVSGTRPRR